MTTVRIPTLVAAAVAMLILSSCDNTGGNGDSTPAVPTGVSASDGTYFDRIEITWNSVLGATGYRVYRPIHPTAEGTLIADTSSTSHTDTYITVGQMYWYSVRAYNSHGESDSSYLDAGFAEGGAFTYDGTTYPVMQTRIRSTATGGVGFTASSSGIDLEETTGIGDAFWIALFSPDATIAEGEYTFADSDAPNYGADYTFEALRIMIHFDIETDEGEVHTAVSGTVTVTRGLTNEMAFDVVLENAEPSTGSYASPVTIF